jgi:hypothetical protein
MPPKKAAVKREPPAQDYVCTLLYGPRNNIIAWREAMEEKCVEKYGMTGTFFTTDEKYFVPYPREEDWHPYPEMLESDKEWESDNETFTTPPSPVTPQGEAEVIDSVQEHGPALPPQPAPPAPASIAPNEPTADQKALIAKMQSRPGERRSKTKTST